MAVAVQDFLIARASASAHSDKAVHTANAVTAIARTLPRSRLFIAGLSLTDACASK